MLLKSRFEDQMNTVYTIGFISWAVILLLHTTLEAYQSKSFIRDLFEYLFIGIGIFFVSQQLLIYLNSKRT
ncbi:hypothetical protein [Jeotgalibacillus campisalis]|uniref:Uncharacterized protein n=1 Tax=Jeotgalibacillus campisalis TaxID=220754 RepID=A0A0C2VGG8_9BACL|nr:hypothetical protein [Jeotgalibacillus campisalis]KIL43083.1 hypothetical protein KR50_34860 [Jeotgalibacillus campisalis]